MDKNLLQRHRNRRNSPSAVQKSPCSKETEDLPPLDSLSLLTRPTFRVVVLLLGAYLGIGTFSFFLLMDHIEGKKTNGILDALYFCIVTMTTVGYGDLVPSSTLAKVLASLYVFTGMALVGLILSKAADYIVEKQEILLCRAFHFDDKSGPEYKEAEFHKVKYKFLTSMAILLVLIAVGLVFLSSVENLDFADALYCVCSTITTLGYGDESFSTAKGRLFAVFWILSSTICLAQFFFYLAELGSESRQRSLVKWLLGRKITSLDLEEADLDQDKAVSVAEFVLHELKRMGKIKQNDIAVLLERFKNLDLNHSGTLYSR
ncbi:hypothetical protein CDL15_Pgr029067 [Punica granatum]|uniref:Potassium channel domain-containing protein n=1 Tax=Punica granatum TaxID=22663 RepID=A0A218XL85_PUNGR|nr:hypothetical protein CDL15_Pgr029067 [Punica granatum]